MTQQRRTTTKFKEVVSEQKNLDQQNISQNRTEDIVDKSDQQSIERVKSGDEEIKVEDKHLDSNSKDNKVHDIEDPNKVDEELDLVRQTLQNVGHTPVFRPGQPEDPEEEVDIVDMISL